MQGVHHRGKLSSHNVWQMIQRQCDRIIDGPFLAGGCRLQDVADDGVLVARMADANTQSGEVGTAELGEDIPQPVVPTVAAATLEANGAWR